MDARTDQELVSESHPGAVAQSQKCPLTWSTEYRVTYALADLRNKTVLASTNPDKIAVVKELIRRHPGDRILIIGQYLSQLDLIQEVLGVPMITGSTPNGERERIYSEFREGIIPILIVSKVGNFAVDIPDANVLIQISGAFGR